MNYPSFDRCEEVGLDGTLRTKETEGKYTHEDVIHAALGILQKALDRRDWDTVARMGGRIQWSGWDQARNEDEGR